MGEMDGDSCISCGAFAMWGIYCEGCSFQRALDLDVVLKAAKELVEEYSPTAFHEDGAEWQECVFCNATGWDLKHFEGCPWVVLENAIKVMK